MSCGQVGAIQTRGTCWFFSIINGFLLSDAGQKILFASLEKFYKGLDVSEKLYFDDGIDAPCPLRADIIKTKRIYFYKFLDQYLCYRSGPRSVSAKMGRSGQILGVASLAGTLAKAHHGGQGAHPAEELPKILKHLGLTDYLVANELGRLPPDQAKKRPHFVVCKAPAGQGMNILPRFRPGTYEYMCCSVTLGNSNASNTQQHKYHAVTGFMCDGKGYLFDSNQRKPFPCKWWNYLILRKVVNEEVARFYDFFAGGQINYLAYNYVIFSRNDYIKSIHPVCRLKYKKTKTPVNSINRNPAQIAALKRARARNSMKPLLGKDFFNSLPRNIPKANLNKQIKNLENAGYKVNMAAYKNFQNSPVALPIRLNSPRTERKKNIENKFNVWWKSLNKNNRNTVRGYMARHKSPSPTANRVANAFRNINTLKTAKARAEWIKAKKLNFKKEELDTLKNYVRKKNQANRNRRAAKKAS
jgi:hypothetical protein